MLSVRIPKILIFSLLATALVAQDGMVRGPVSGSVYDGAARAIRPILGLPGASYLGPAILADLDFASISPNGKMAIVEAAGRLYAIHGLDTGTPRWSLLGKGGATRTAWGPNSDAVAVYSDDTGRLRLGKGLGQETGLSKTRLSSRSGRSYSPRPDAQGAPWLADLGEVRSLGGSVTALAVDGRGNVIVGIDDEAAGGLFLVHEGSSPMRIAAMASPSGIVIADGRILASDRSRSEILEIGDYEDAADVTIFAGRGRGIDAPAALAISGDRASLMVANSGDRRLVFFDLGTRALVSRIELDFEPSRLARLAGGSVYLLNARESDRQTLQVLANGPRPAVFFVPAASAAAASQATSVED